MTTIEIQTEQPKPVTVDVGMVAGALAEIGYTVLPYPINYPTIEVREGRPRLPSLPENPDAEAHGGRAGFYRLEAAQKLALADWYEAKAENDARATARMIKEAEQFGLGIDGKTAVALVNAGWHR